jgi:tape measure domain-containing protein
MATTNNVQYQISLRDLLSSTVNRAAGNVAKFDTEIDKTIADINRLNSAMSQSGGQSFMQTTGAVALGSILTRGVEMAGRAAVSQVKDILSAGLDASKLRAEFATLAGDAGIGDALFGDINKYVSESIFGTELFDVSKQLMAYGIGTNEILADLKMLGDVAMGDAEKMKSLSLAFGQTTAAGKLMGSDMIQYISAGFNPLKELERTTGRTYADLKDAMSEGAISSDMVAAAFKSATSEGGLFFGMLDKIGETPFGKMQAMQGNIAMAKQQLGEALLPAMADFMDATKPLIESLPAMFKALQPQLKSAIDGFSSLAKWTAANTETIGKFAHGIKLIAEGYVAWKAGTALITAATWAHGRAIQANIWLRGEETIAVNALTLATERLAVANAAANGTGLVNSYGAPIASAVATGAARSGIVTTVARAAGTGVGMFEAFIGMSVSTLVGVALAAAGGVAVISATAYGMYQNSIGNLSDKGLSSGKSQGNVLVSDVGKLDGVGRVDIKSESKWGKRIDPKPKKPATPSTTLKSDVAKITGQQVKNIYITINGGLIHDFTVKTTSVKESIPDIKRIVTQVLTDSINDSQITD